MTDQKKMELKEKLYDCVVSGKNPDGLCSCIAGVIGNPVSIHLPSRTIIARSSDFTRELTDDFIHAFAMADQLDISSTFDTIVKKLKTRKPIIEAFPYYRYKQVLYGCFAEGHLTAILDSPVLHKTDLTFTAEVLELASPAIISVLRQSGYLGPKEAHHMQVYLNALLRGEKQPLYQQLSIANSAINNTAAWKLLWIRSADEETAASEIRPAIERVCSRKEKLWCTEFENGIVVLCDATLENRIEEIINLCQDNSTIVISDLYTDLPRTAEIYEQCRNVFEIAYFEHNAPGGSDLPPVIYVSEYKTALYFLYSYLKGDPRDWKNSKLIQIRNYDMQNETEYYETLRAFLLCEMNYTKMAELLHIHKNTVNYRMQRIAELFDLNLKDCRVITDLYLTMFIITVPPYVKL